MSSLREFAGVLFSRGGFFAVFYGILFAFQVMRLNLLYKPFILVMSIIFAWTVLWLVSTFNRAKPVAVGVSLFLAWATLSNLRPDVADALERMTIPAERAAPSPSPPAQTPEPRETDDGYQPLVPESDGFQPIAPDSTAR
ncbi:MAG TPA: hypothetical protein VD862_00870 [Candidatus Paceibacterota bacterium]|nr:hypothetical protein [Candidatus Paceibacterota bacterium]